MGKSKLFGGGTAMGRYVWRKSEIVQPKIAVTNPTGNFQITLQNGYLITLTSYNSEIDFNNMSAEEILVYFSGFAATDGTDGFYLDYSYGLWYRYASGYNSKLCISSPEQLQAKGSNYAVFLQPTGSLVLTSRPIMYTGTKIIQNLVANPLCFVCSNKADQYPSDGEYQGYWYELIGTIESTNALSLSNLSADTMRNISVEEIQKGVTDGIL